MNIKSITDVISNVFMVIIDMLRMVINVIPSEVRDFLLIIVSFIFAYIFYRKLRIMSRNMILVIGTIILFIMFKAIGG